MAHWIAAPRRCRSARGGHPRAARHGVCWGEAVRSRAIRSQSGHIGSCVARIRFRRDMKAAVRLPTPLRTLAQSGSLTKSRFAKSPKRASLMSISLYDLSVPTFLQTVNALAGVLDRADEHWGHDPDDFVEVRLI